MSRAATSKISLVDSAISSALWKGPAYKMSAQLARKVSTNSRVYIYRIKINQFVMLIKKGAQTVTIQYIYTKSQPMTADWEL